MLDSRSTGRGERRSYWLSCYHSPALHRHRNATCVYIFMFSVAALLDNQKGGATFHAWLSSHYKLCKDMGNKVNSVFAPDMQRFVSSLEVGHIWKLGHIWKYAQWRLFCCGA